MTELRDIEKQANVSTAEVNLHGSFDRIVTDRANENNNTVPTKEWPSEPQPLVKVDPTTFLLNTILDGFLFEAPILLIIKAGMVIHAAKHDAGKSGLASDPVSSWTTNLIQFNTQLATLFTIIFGTVIATFVKRYALYNAQEGAKIIELEQFQASITLPSTLKTVYSLRSWTWTSAALVFVWSWYYLGSQAMQREYIFQQSASAQHVNLVFRSAKAPSYFQPSDGLASASYNKLTTINAISTIALQTSGLPAGSYVDNFGAPLLPLLNQSNQAPFGTPDENGWQTVPTGSFWPTSYLGIPTYFVSNISGISSHFIGKISDLSTSYIYPDCADSTAGSDSDFPAGLLPTISTSMNMSSSNSSEGFPVMDLWLRSANSSFHSKCVLRRYQIQLQGKCDAVACSFGKVKPNHNADIAFDSPASEFFDKEFASSFFSELLLSTGVPASFDDTPPMGFTLGITYDNSSDTWSSSNGASETAAVSGQVISAGLTAVLNTYMRASQVPGGIAFEDTVDEVSKAAAGTSTDPTWSRASAKGAAYSPKYVLSVPWLVIDFISCAVLLVAAFWSSRLRQKTVAPDVFGYVSSMTRDNPHIPLPEGGTTLSGVERTRAMRNVRVKIADLSQDDHVGHVGLTVEHESAIAVHLDGKKTYI